ncbi:MAG: hypothetical protein HY695_18550 [Deltaproteobacteria bacterium]|nr:hypothetical protein [Deltaproteobacteria bacterium]
MIPDRLMLWIAFNLCIVGMLAIDLGVFHRKAHAVSLREAAGWSLIWVVLALFLMRAFALFGDRKKRSNF